MNKEIDFSNPPINEVVLGIYFERLPGFRVVHFGEFRLELPADFTRFEDQPAIVREVQQLDVTNPLLRCWFSTDDGRRLVQLQQDRIVFNWRKMDGLENYPKFASIRPQFLDVIERFDNFLDRKEISPSVNVKQLELTYVNIIAWSDLGDRLPHIGDILVDHKRQRHEGRFLPEAKDFSWVTVYPLPDDAGSLTVDARSAQKADNPDEKVLRLSLSAIGGPQDPDPSELPVWYDMAHEQIVKGFADLTDTNVQTQVWGENEMIALQVALSDRSIKAFEPTGTAAAFADLNLQFSGELQKKDKQLGAHPLSLRAPRDDNYRNSEKLATIFDIHYERAKASLITILNSGLLSAISYDDDCATPLNVASARSAAKFVDRLPSQTVLPKVAPDGEGDIMFIWGNPPTLLMTIEQNLLHLVLHPASARSRHLEPVEFDGEVIPREIAAHIPRA